MARILDGKAIAAEMEAELSRQSATLMDAGTCPTLAVVLVGDDPASHSYVRAKRRAGERVGIRTRDHLLPGSATASTLLELIGELNRDASVHGILVQLPLPPQIATRDVLEAITPEKDVDGFHPRNLGALVQYGTPMPPCTPAGILELIRRSGTTVAGMEAVVVGRSNMVGKPTALMLLQANATVTICHSATRDLASACRRAEILVVAIGRARFIPGNWIREGAVVIDVGTNRLTEGPEAGRLVGDVDFVTAEPRAGAITPVPGGVGPMTVIMLMQNTLTAARLQSSRRTDGGHL